MSDQSGDVGGATSFNSPTGVADPSSFSFSPPATSAGPTFGAPPSAMAAGGGAVSAPSFSAPSASPAGFDPQTSDIGGLRGGVGSDPMGAPMAAPSTMGGGSGGGDVSGGGMGGGSGGGAPGGSNSVMNAIRNPGVDSILNAVGGNLGPLASLGILGFEAANKPGGIGGSGQQLPAGAQPGPTGTALVQEAGTLQTAGQALSQPLATGVLPPGAQASIDQVTQQQEAQIRQQFAAMGLTGSSMEASAIAQAQQAAQARGFALAQDMAKQGLADMGLSSNIFSELLTTGLQQDQGFQDALLKFAESMAGGGGTTIKVGGGG
jgi:hypothetical protein